MERGESAGPRSIDAAGLRRAPASCGTPSEVGTRVSHVAGYCVSQRSLHSACKHRSAIAGPAHFFAVAARLLRRILVDHAKSRGRAKRGGGQIRVTLNEYQVIQEPDREMIALDDSLRNLAEFDERKSHIIELHFFGGLTYEEIAEALSISPTTVHRELRLAKAWLYHELQKKGEAE
jgi:RNA polymerase sigma factor (TIGR02999 family)